MTFTTSLRNRKFLIVLFFALLAIGTVSYLFRSKISVKVSDRKSAKNLGVLENYRTLPKGYAVDSYKIEKNLGVECKNSNECETPFEYLIQSRCPFTTLCLQNSCQVVCPDYIP